ncbi:MAG TPA: XRE family transcriptional regulator [Candidatus Omnitrophota bacterium]|nr:XRE family transcriptional regulator [Candidatus Omnitrophota bacterium]
MEIGKRIREVRKAKKITLVELAANTGVAQATLSRIETGIMTGTVDSHQRIAKALGLSLAELYAGIDERLQTVAHQSKSERNSVSLHGGKIRREVLTQQAGKKKITPFLLTLEAGSETEIEKLEAGIEKFFYVLEGEITARIEKKDFTLKEGETLYFEGSLPHQFANTSGRKAKILYAVSPPSL